FFALGSAPARSSRLTSPASLLCAAISNAAAPPPASPAAAETPNAAMASAAAASVGFPRMSELHELTRGVAVRIHRTSRAIHHRQQHVRERRLVGILQVLPALDRFPAAHQRRW